MTNTVSIPQTGFLRQRQILGNPKANPPEVPLIPVSPTTWKAGVKSGRFPKPIRISEAIIAWRAEDIRALIDELGSQARK